MKDHNSLSWEAFKIQTLHLICNMHRRRQWHPHSSTLAWKIPWTEEPIGCSPWGLEESDTTERPHFHFSLSCIGGNGNPLQCSCLENPRDGGAWWAAVYGVAQSRTRLKWLSSSSYVLQQEISLLLVSDGGKICIQATWALSPCVQSLWFNKSLLNPDGCKTCF